MVLLELLERDAELVLLPRDRCWLREAVDRFCEEEVELLPAPDVER
ncbi:MAG: hypothetical protein KTR29_10105 [Rhodothermaceae bacterium]|nr:hypothetical protein [Rhodothermaceae bacterium]